MKRKVKEKLRAISLREKGYSLNEIVNKLDVAKSSVSLWVRNVALTNKARNRLLTKIRLGQLVAAENARRKTQEVLKEHFSEALRNLSSLRINRISAKTFCSLLYCCEGAKSLYSGVQFTNSDPQLVKTFLNLLRQSFDINEEKFRVCVHLHDYHNKYKQIKFWSEITGIDHNQFIKPFYKKNVGKRIRKDYNGCVSIRYHSADIGRQLLMTGKAFLTKFQ